MTNLSVDAKGTSVALFTRAWIEIYLAYVFSEDEIESPSSRGRGLKSALLAATARRSAVALFTRAWIEIARADFLPDNLVRRPLHEGVD